MTDSLKLTIVTRAVKDLSMTRGGFFKYVTSFWEDPEVLLGKYSSNLLECDVI